METSDVYIYEDGEIKPYLKRVRIAIWIPKKMAVIARDGRPLRYVNGVWVYYPNPEDEP